MNEYRYQGVRARPRRRPSKRVLIVLLLLLLAAYGAYTFLSPSPVERAVSQLRFDASVSEAEKQTITQAITDQRKSYRGDTTVSVKTSTDEGAGSRTLQAYVPVTSFNAIRQGITSDELRQVSLYVPEDTDESVKKALADAVGISEDKLLPITDLSEELGDEAVALIPADQLDARVKLLALDDTYYLDGLNAGAIFRVAQFTGDAGTSLADLQLNDLPTHDNTLKVNMTGVTALTRVMMKKLPSVGGPTYFSEKIGDFLADADITHVSNEVSFRTGCQYSNVSFCSPPEFIETLKASGVDLVELTGNHNNDNGNTYNTESIDLYHSLGWQVFGGGLNRAEAAKPYIADLKGSKVAFLGYNMADGAGSGAIAGETTAGANIFTEDKAKADIAAAKQQAQFVIVDIQYAECQAYPAGYVEFPECDGTIGGQEAAFRSMIDLGADMVIGSSAHQPQTYELYEGKPIYYGLGNLYFEQTQWPGTERGIILTHYFVGGKLVQTKLTPTVYDKALQTRPMDGDEANYLLERLHDAR